MALIQDEWGVIEKDKEKNYAIAVMKRIAEELHKAVDESEKEFADKMDSKYDTLDKKVGDFQNLEGEFPGFATVTAFIEKLLERIKAEAGVRFSEDEELKKKIENVSADLSVHKDNYLSFASTYEQDRNQNEAYRNAMGQNSSLKTDNKSTIVGAINELLGNIGNLYLLELQNQPDIVSAINNVVSALNEVNRKTKSFIEYNGNMGSGSSIKGFTLGAKAAKYRITPMLPTSGTVENPAELKRIENITITDFYSDEEMLSLHGINICPGDCLSYSEGIIRYMDMLTLDGSEKWTLHEKGFFYTVNNTISRPTSNTSVAIIRSSHFSEVSFNNIGYASSAPADKSIAISGTASGANWLCIRYCEKTTVEEFKEWLSQNPVTVLYKKTARTVENIEMPDFVFSNTECEATYVKGKKVNFTEADIEGVTGDVDAYLLYEADVDIAHAVEIYEIEQALLSLGANI